MLALYIIVKLIKKPRYGDIDCSPLARLRQEDSEGKAKINYTARL